MNPEDEVAELHGLPPCVQRLRRCRSGARVAAAIRRRKAPPVPWPQASDGAERCRVPVRSGAGLRHRGQARGDASIAASTSASVSVRSSAREREPVGQALARRRRAAGRGRCRTGSTSAAAARHAAGCRRDCGAARRRRRRPPGRARRPDGVTARPRAHRLSRPPARPATASSATMIRSPRSSSASTTRGWSSPSGRVRSAVRASTGPAAPGMEDRVVRRAARSAGAGKPRRRQISSTTPFASSRSYGSRDRFQAAARRRRSARRPSRHHSCVAAVRGRRRSPCRSRRSRHRRALAQVGRDDLEQAAEQALAEDRVLARQRVGQR